MTPTPLPAVDIFPYEDIPQSISELGFPRLGSPDAPVQIVEFCAFDTRECAAYHTALFDAETFNAVLDAIFRGDALYTYVPLVTDNAAFPNGRGAARAAVCAGEQGAFWAFARALYDWQTLYGAAAFDGARLLEGIDGLGINRAAWDACMSGTQPDDALAAAQTLAEMQTDFTALPLVGINGVPSLPDMESIGSAIALELAEAESTAPAPEATESLVVTVSPLLGERVEPPLDIQLPPGWRYGYDTLLLDDVDVAMRTILLAVYTGPVSGGTGTIVLLWGFPNLMGGNPFTDAAAQPDLWADGLRLLRLAVIEQGCNIGTDLRADYEIGGLAAVGTQFSAVDCPELPDTRGWFAGMQQNGINFVFYVFTDPIDAMNAAEGELQAVLDTIVFQIPASTPQP